MPVLSDAHETAIANQAPRLQIIACAGAGKTEVLARRAVRLMLEGADPASLIAFTFTEKAASELKSRIEMRAAKADSRFAELPPVARGMFIGTTHAWALQSLRNLGGWYELAEGVSEEEEWVLLQRVARRLGVVDLYAAWQGKATDRVATGPAVRAFLRSVEVVHNDRIDRDELRSRAPHFAAVLDRYEWLLENARLLPFRMMIAKALEELTSGKLEDALRGTVRHVLVDEFQDFNPSQDQLLAGLCALGATVTVVGDDDQAIYQWRGGDVSLFVSFADRYGDVVQSPLERNYRCRPEIVAFARHAVDSLDRRLSKVLEAARTETVAGAVEVAVAATPTAEATAIAGRIARLMAEGQRAGDIAVLFRSVRTSALPLVEELRKRDMPVSVVGKTSLLARPEMALIARIVVWWAGGTWYPNPEFTMEIVTREELIQSIADVAGISPESGEAQLELIDQLGARIRTEGVQDSILLFNQILSILGLPRQGDAIQEQGLGRMSELLTQFDHSARRALPAEFYRGQPAAVADEMAEDSVLAADREPPSTPVLGATRGEVYLMRLRAFLEEFAGRAAEVTPDVHTGGIEAVQVMTIHQAKGLEFQVVFVPSLVEGRFPSALMGRRQDWYLPDDLFDRDRYEGREDDEARLLYVALTRARELLAVSWFQEYDSGRPAKPSRLVRRQLRGALQEALGLGVVSSVEAAMKRQRDELIDLDFSTLVTYIECAYRYWLRHICGFSPPRATELGFGRLLHHLVAELARRAADGESPSEDLVDRLLDEAFYLPFASAVPRAKLRESARQREKRYLRRNGNELARTMRPEAPFEVPLGAARLRGRIDLMLRGEGDSDRAVELIDFKTSENRPPSELHQNQLRLYATMAQKMGWEPVRLAIHDLDLEHGDRHEVSFDPERQEVFLGQLAGWIEGIKSGPFVPPEDRQVCFACDFRAFCHHAPPEARESVGTAL